MEHFLDIFFLAAIAIFILYRLFKVLGQDTGFRPESVNAEQPMSHKEALTAEQTQKTRNLGDKIDQIRTYDSSFDKMVFLQGATKAFEMIVNSFNEGDKTTIQTLVDKKLCKNFEDAIDEASANKETWDNSLIRIQNVELIDLKKKGNMILATVKFTSDQIIATRDANGYVIEGDPDQIEILTDQWTFGRDINSPDPNWMLVATSETE